MNAPEFPVIIEDGEESPWIALKIDHHLANTTEDIDRNIEYALSRDYIPFGELVNKHQGAVAVVGSGPSLKGNWPELRNFKGDIFACNAACQFLLERDIVPKYMMCFDADPLMLEFITPHKDITYLMGSRCPPQAFDVLAGCRVVCWHANGDEHISELLTKHGKMEPMIAGGTAAITRAMMMVHPMGYRTVHLYGADSSFNGSDTHIRRSTTDEKWLHIMCNNRDFWCAPWMAQQAEDFKILAPTLRGNYGVRLVVHGDGLIPHLAHAMGFETDKDSRFQRIAREAVMKTRILWQQL